MPKGLVFSFDICLKEYCKVCPTYYLSDSQLNIFSMGTHPRSARTLVRLPADRDRPARGAP
jgi:hypothetical protein